MQEEERKGEGSKERAIQRKALTADSEREKGCKRYAYYASLANPILATFSFVPSYSLCLGLSLSPSFFLPLHHMLNRPHFSPVLFPPKKDGLVFSLHK